MNTGTGTLIVIADCVPKKEAPDLVTRKDSGTVTDDGSTVTSSCKKKEQAVSAGFTSNTDFEPFEFHRGAKRTWGIRGQTFIADGKATVLTYCEKPASPANLPQPTRPDSSAVEHLHGKEGVVGSSPTPGSSPPLRRPRYSSPTSHPGLGVDPASRALIRSPEGTVQRGRGSRKTHLSTRVTENLSPRRCLDS